MSYEADEAMSMQWQFVRGQEATIAALHFVLSASPVLNFFQTNK